jgi:phosphate transport system substrate-binding protein
MKIYVMDREPEDSTRTVLEDHIPGFGRIRDRRGKVIYSTPESVEVLRKYPGTIGYSALAAVQGGGLIIISLEGVAPTTGNVRKGAYKYSSPFGVVWKGALTGAPKKFVDYLRSAEAGELIAAHGAVATGQDRQ